MISHMERQPTLRATSLLIASNVELRYAQPKQYPSKSTQQFSPDARIETNGIAPWFDALLRNTTTRQLKFKMNRLVCVRVRVYGSGDERLLISHVEEETKVRCADCRLQG